MCNEEHVKYLKSVDFVTEAQEFRIATLDGLVSFPVGFFYRSCKGGSNKIKIYDRKTEELLQACRNCILSSSNCIVSCMKKVFPVTNAVDLDMFQRKRYDVNADFVNWMAFNVRVCAKCPGFRTLNLLRELT